MTCSDTEEGSLLSSGQAPVGNCRSLLLRRVPILDWAPRYDRLTAASDLVAGITLGLMLVPQSIAYASLADLPVQYGLYSAFMEEGSLLSSGLALVGNCRSLLSRRVPILDWAPRYYRLTAASDLVAGITLGSMLVPQSIAYASLADLPVQYGLYSAFMEEGSLLSSGLAPVGNCRSLLLRRVPILDWAPRYDRLTAASDLVAGITLGLMLVPQSIAYASLADMPVQYGLYSAFMGEGTLLSSGLAPVGNCRSLLLRRVPILDWAPRYDRLTAASDLVAGITLGLMLVPQSIAYASLADLPVHYGLYSAFMGTMLYTVFGTVKEVSIGPTSLMSLLTLQTCRGLPVEFVILLTFLSGCVVMLMGLLRLGGLVELISPSVTSGFTSATAVIITISQLKGLLGLKFTAENLWENASEIFRRIHLTRFADLGLGVVCCSLLLLLRKLKDLKVSSKRPVLRKTLWFISIGRNALVVLGASVFAYCTYNPKNPIIKLSGVVEPGVPPLSIPAFSVTMGNSTLSFVDMVQRLGAGVIMMPVVMVFANIAIAKAFTSGGRVDATQEMLTLGLCNVAGSFFHSLPTCGAFTRSAVSHSSGVRTPAAGIYSGVITLLALAFLTEFFFYIPTACLSSVLICAVIFMVDISTVVKLWRENRSELGVLTLTFVVGVTKTMELSILVGTLASLAVLLRKLMNAKISTHSAKWGRGRCVCVCPTVALVYLNAEDFAPRALAAASRLPREPVLLDCSQIGLLDHAGAQVIARIAKNLKESDQQLIPYGAWGSGARRLSRIPNLEVRALRCSSLAEAYAALSDDKECVERTDS